MARIAASATRTFFRWVFCGCSAIMSPTLPGGRNLLGGTSTTRVKNILQPSPLVSPLLPR